MQKKFSPEQLVFWLVITAFATAALVLLIVLFIAVLNGIPKN